MNQNNIQRIRQVTPEEIAQARGTKLTQEELQKTHVLNLQEVKEAVRYEKMTSKKPAILVAVLGFLLITFGTSFQIANSLSAKNMNNKIEQRSTENKEAIFPQEDVKTSYLSCKLYTPNNPDGTDTTFSILYTFLDDKLSSFTKTFHVVVTTGSTNGNDTVQRYLKNYQAFLNQLDGYQISVNPINNGLIVTVNVNYNLLDVTLLPEKQQTHFSTKVDYAIDTPYEKIKQDMASQNYICE